MKFIVPALLLLLFACSPGKRKAAEVAEVDTASLQLPNPFFITDNGTAYYREVPFTGTTIERYPSDNVKRSVGYKRGKEDGFTFAFYENNQMEFKRFYTKGEKDNVHTGWWPNGNKRFEYHFRNGSYNGAFKEWYESGNLAKDLSYINGVEAEGKGWRDNGKVYMSFVVKDGRRYGLVNAQLCYSIKNERGEYVENTK